MTRVITWLSARSAALAVAGMVMALFLCAPAGADTTYSERFTVVNNCGDNAWMWIVPPGPDIAEEQSQFWQTVNHATFVCKNGDNPCATRNYQWKIEIPAGATMHFKIPDSGSASNKYYFDLGCTKTTGTFAEWGDCKIGGKFGTSLLGNDMSGSNTWFEATWGCKPGATCAKNPSKPSEDLSPVDWMDLSVVDGYTVPMTLTLGPGEAASHNCQYNSGDAWDGIEDASFLDLASCPTETSDSLWTIHPEVAAVLAAGGLSLLTEDEGNYVNCVAPYKWFSSLVLGQSVPGLSRPVTAGSNAGDLNEVNWYGCKGTCGQTAGSPPCTCPECSPDACLAGPRGNGTYTVARTNYVRNLKAMGMQAYTWQYDDNSGNKHCDQGVTVTITLCPIKKSQKPYLAGQKWAYDQASGKCTLADSGFDSYYQCITSSSRYSLVLDHGVNYCMPDGNGDYADYAACMQAVVDPSHR